MTKAALWTAAAIFALVGLAHLLRFALAIPVVVADVAVPVFPSLPVGIVVLLLAWWMVVAARRA